jgi:drug/metabolite transporter (DMT)-like permease
MPRKTYLLLGITILLWSTVGYTGYTLREIPSFFLTGAGLLIGGLTGLAQWKTWKLRPSTWVIGIAGLGGYHLLLFTALKTAPAIEVNILNYLWPLFLVVLSPIILHEKLGWESMFGAIVGLAGTIVILSGGKFNSTSTSWGGYAMAIGAALTWAFYSPLTRKAAPFPSSAVCGFCLGAGIICLTSFGCSTHFDLTWMSSVPAGHWLLLVLMGIGPLGLAFITWDAAMKSGDPQKIGSFSYLTPLLSTGLLALTGSGKLNAASGIGLVFIVCGAALGAKRG